MSTDSPQSPPRPDAAQSPPISKTSQRPLNACEPGSLTPAQYTSARLYVRASWPTLKAHVDRFRKSGRSRIIETNDLASVRINDQSTLRFIVPRATTKRAAYLVGMRVPLAATSARLAMAEWMSITL